MDLQKSSEPLEPSFIFTKKFAIFSALAIYLVECFLIWRQSRARTLAAGSEDAANKRSRLWQSNSAFLFYLISVESVALDAVPWLWLLVEAYQVQYLPSYASEFWKSSLFLLACGLIYIGIDGVLSLLRMFIYKGESRSSVDTSVWKLNNVWIDATNGKPTPAVLLLYCINTLVFKAFGAQLRGSPYIAVTMVEIYLPFILWPIYLQSRAQKASRLDEGDLRLSIEGTASKVKFPLKNLHITTGPLEGLEKGVQLLGWPKKNSICIHEALLSSLSNDEITALVASRLGEWKRCVSLITYAFSLIFFSNLFTYVMLFIRDRASYEEFGFKDEYPMVAGVLLFCVAMAKPCSALFSVQRNTMSYFNNFVPDKFAAESGHLVDLQAALGKIAELQEEKGSDWLHSLYFNGEPTIMERLKKLEKIATEKALKEDTVTEKKTDAVNMA